MRPAIWQDGSLSLHPHELVEELYVLGDGDHWITLHKNDVRAMERATHAQTS